MCAPRNQTSPSLTTAYASLICALPSRSDLTSLPRSSIPASIFSSTWNLWRARRLVATSPLAGTLGPFDFRAMPLNGLPLSGHSRILGRKQIDASARGVHSVHAYRHRIANPDGATAPRADEHRLGGVELVALPPPDPACRQEALVDVGESS